MLLNKPSVRFAHLHVAKKKKNGIKHGRPSWLGHYLVNKK